MARYRSCSWCHELNCVDPGAPDWCKGCSHNARVPMALCDCLMCWRPGAGELPPDPYVPQPVPDPDGLAELLPAELLPAEVLDQPAVPEVLDVQDLVPPIPPTSEWWDHFPLRKN